MRGSFIRSAYACILFLTVMSALASAQDSTLMFQNRSLRQEQCAIEFLNSRDSLYHAEHGRWRAFSDRSDIDSFMDGFQRAWRTSAATTDTNYLRIDSYVYLLIQAEKHASDWACAYIFRKYRLPSFLSDFAFCSKYPSADKAFILWPGNTQVFENATGFDLPRSEWHQLLTAYFQMPSLLETYLSFGPRLDSLSMRDLRRTQHGLSELKTFYEVSTALYSNELDKAFTLLTTGFCEPRSPVADLSALVRELAFKLCQRGDSAQSLAILDVAEHWTTAADLSRDSLLTWYVTIDPTNGYKHFEKVSHERSLPALVPSGKQVDLSGKYTNLVDGRTFDFSTARGKILLIDFWTTWCGPCNDEIPSLNEFATHFGRLKDFVFVAVSSDAIDGGASKSAVAKFVRKKGIKYVVIYDKPRSSLTKLFGVEGFPTKFVVNPSGEIMQRPDGNRWIDLKAVRDYLTQKE